jgi:RimK family alpha-L-glutamate ligase
VYYVQEFVPHGCEDIRAFVVGGEVVAAMVRHGRTWKTNMAQGAAAQPVELDDGLRNLAARAARAVGAVYAGVDLLPLEDGQYSVIEVNGIPGWRGLQAANGVDVADRLVEYVLGSTQGGGIDR